MRRNYGAAWRILQCGRPVGRRGPGRHPGHPDRSDAETAADGARHPAGARRRGGVAIVGGEPGTAQAGAGAAGPGAAADAPTVVVQFAWAVMVENEPLARFFRRGDRSMNTWELD